MKMNFKSLLAGNLITVIIIFVLLSFFDQSGDPMRNIIVVFVGFVLMTSYDFIRTRKDKKIERSNCYVFLCCFHRHFH